MLNRTNMRRILFEPCPPDIDNEDDYVSWAIQLIQPTSMTRRISDWVHEALGYKAARDKNERMCRFAEEALELLQVCGMTQREIKKLMRYVYKRPVGEFRQEIGGVGVTLNALCDAYDVSFEQAVYDELRRCWQNIDKIRAKHITKPRRSPLPGTGKKTLLQKFYEWKKRRR